MTTEIFESKNGNVSVTRFSLGLSKDGLGIQITARHIEGQTHNENGSHDWVQMPANEFEEMVKAFIEFKKIKDF